MQVAPPDLEHEKGYDVNEAVKSLIPSTPKSRRPSTMADNGKRGSMLDASKIAKLRQEYAAMGKIMEVRAKAD